MGIKISYERERDSRLYLELWKHFHDVGLSGSIGSLDAINSDERKIELLESGTFPATSNFIMLVEGNLCGVGLGYVTDKRGERPENKMATTIEYIGKEAPEEVLREFTSRGFKKASTLWTI